MCQLPVRIAAVWMLRLSDCRDPKLLYSGEASPPTLLLSSCRILFAAFWLCISVELLIGSSFDRLLPSVTNQAGFSKNFPLIKTCLLQTDTRRCSFATSLISVVVMLVFQFKMKMAKIRSDELLMSKSNLANQPKKVPIKAQRRKFFQKQQS